MIVNISVPDQTVVIDGKGYKFDSFDKAEIPAGIRNVSIDTDANIGSIVWEGSFPSLPITADQFKAMFYPCIAMHEQAVANQADAELEAKRVLAKVDADNIAAQQQAQLDEIERKAKLQDLQNRVEALEAKEKL